MEKKLPKVFANPISKKLANNSYVYYGEKDRNVAIEGKSTYKESINNKISKIFKSPRYVYKIDVEITTNQGVQMQKIIGKNANNLITIDNKLIPIANIIDIKEVK